MGSSKKLTLPKKIDVDYENPDFNSNKEKSPRTVFLSTHEAWHRTYDKAKERYMLGQGGDPGAYDSNKVQIEIGSKYATRYGFGTQTRHCNKSVDLRRNSPGPGEYDNTTQKK